jgi:hypothetical protein
MQLMGPYVAERAIQIQTANAQQLTCQARQIAEAYGGQGRRRVKRWEAICIKASNIPPNESLFLAPFA